MSEGIFISPNQYVSFAELDRSSLKQEIASRAAAWDFSEYVGLLPDPDPILAKRGDGAEILESLTSDGHLLSVIQSRKLGTLKREIKWNPGAEDGEKPSSQAEQLCKDFVADLKGINLYNLISSLLDAPFYGMTPVEIFWEPGEHLKIKDLQAKPGRWFGFDDTNKPRFRSIEKEEEGEELPWGKFVFARHFPTYDNPYGLRLLSRCFWPVTFKKGGLKFWVTFTEKYGMPFLLGKFSKGALKEDQDAMLTSLQKMVRDAVAVVPEGNTVEMLGGSGKTGGSYLAFERLKSAMDSEVSKVIQGQTLTTEASDKGTHALGKTHENILSVFQESDQQLVKTTLEEIAAIYAKVNTSDVLPPKCTYFEEEDPQKDFADRDKILSETGQFRLTKSYYIRRYGFQEDDIEMVEPGDEQDAGTQEHSEKQPGDNKQFTPEQQALEDLVDRGQAVVDFSENEKLILQVIQEAGSYEEAMENILALYPDLTDGGLEAVIENVIFTADIFGRWTVQES